jgi:hypothetical protein
MAQILVKVSNLTIETQWLKVTILVLVSKIDRENKGPL